MDLNEKNHNPASIDQYILGSAEVVGLMCLRIFCEGDNKQYELLKPSAMKLGSAFQKINFLRDVKADFHHLGRTYFPDLDFNNFNDVAKKKIEANIAEDFAAGYEGIKRLPRKARFGVYVAYIYYLALFKKIKNLPSRQVMSERIRIRNRYKITLLLYSFFKHQFNLI
jgi:phytoene/squalene synthetase